MILFFNSRTWITLRWVNWLLIVKCLIIKPARCTDFSNLFLEWNSTCFGQFLCPSSGIFHCTRGNGICHTGVRTACEQDQDGTAFNPDPARKLSANLYDIRLLRVQWKTSDDGQRNCPKHVVLFQEQIWEISASSWFYCKKFNTMHSHMNVKMGELTLVGTWLHHWFPTA
jgi:hypothetical protein